MYEISVMISVFFIVIISCWWIGDGNEPLENKQKSTPVYQAPRFQIQEQAGLGD